MNNKALVYIARTRTSADPYRRARMRCKGSCLDERRDSEAAMACNVLLDDAGVEDLNCAVMR